jgi:hypothetical protein
VLLPGLNCIPNLVPGLNLARFPNLTSVLCHSSFVLIPIGFLCLFAAAELGVTWRGFHACRSTCLPHVTHVSLSGKLILADVICKEILCNAMVMTQGRVVPCTVYLAAFVSLSLRGHTSSGVLSGWISGQMVCCHSTPARELESNRQITCNALNGARLPGRILLITTYVHGL